MRSAEASHYICDGKPRFTNPQLANAVLRRRAKGGRSDEVFRCPSCGYWHIGRGVKPPHWQRARYVVGHAHA